MAFDLLDAGKRGVLTAEAITSFLGNDIDTSILRDDMQAIKSLVCHHADGITSAKDEVAIDQATFFKAWQVAGVAATDEGDEGNNFSTMMSTDD